MVCTAVPAVKKGGALVESRFSGSIVPALGGVGGVAVCVYDNSYLGIHLDDLCMNLIYKAAEIAGVLIALLTVHLVAFAAGTGLVICSIGARDLGYILADNRACGYSLIKKAYHIVNTDLIRLVIGKAPLGKTGRLHIILGDENVKGVSVCTDSLNAVAVFCLKHRGLNRAS